MVGHEVLVERLRGLGIDVADLTLITNLYWGQRAVLKVGDDKSEWVDIKRGVRQGCVLSPDLFSLYSQAVMNELEDIEGVKVGGSNINNIRYADDTVLIADTNARLQSLVDKLDVECNRMGLKINIGKREVMGITKRKGQLTVVVNIGGQRVKQVSSFRYLGSLVSEDGKCDAEIRSRIAMGKARFGQMRRILTSMSLSSEVQLRLLKSYIWSGMLYGCESWTISKELRRRLEAAEVWFLRRMLRIPWTARTTNQDVVQTTGTKRELITVIRKRQLGFLGHVLRRNGIENSCLLGKINGKIARGKQRHKYMDCIKEAANIQTTVEVLRAIQDRNVWRSIVANVNIDTALR